MLIATQCENSPEQIMFPEKINILMLALLNPIKENQSEQALASKSFAFLHLCH